MRKKWQSWGYCGESAGMKNRDVQLKVRDGVHVPEGEPKSKRAWQGLLYTCAFFFSNGGTFSFAGCMILQASWHLRR